MNFPNNEKRQKNTEGLPGSNPHATETGNVKDVVPTSSSAASYCVNSQVIHLTEEIIKMAKTTFYKLSMLGKNHGTE